MALRQNTTSAATDSPFEEEEIGTNAANDSSAAAETPAEPAKTTSVANKPAGTVAVTRLPTDTIWALLKEQIPIEELKNLQVGTFPRITATPGALQQDKKDIGKKVLVEVISHNVVYLLSHGEQNNTEANKQIKTSWNGETLEDGTPVVDHIKYMREVLGYKKADIKCYGEIYANVLAYQKEIGERLVMEPVPLDKQQLVQLSLSPQSLSQWQAFMLQAKMRKLKTKQDDPQTVLVTVESKTLGANTFGLMRFEVSRPA